jgi:hypothetical protein
VREWLAIDGSASGRGEAESHALPAATGAERRRAAAGRAIRQGVLFDGGHTLTVGRLTTRTNARVLRVERLVEVVGILGGLWVVEH